MNKKYSVLLLYPDPTDPATYFAHVFAEDPMQALVQARAEAVAANHVCEADYVPEDFLCLAVFQGHTELELGAYDNV